MHLFVCIGCVVIAVLVAFGMHKVTAEQLSDSLRELSVMAGHNDRHVPSATVPGQANFFSLLPSINRTEEFIAFAVSQSQALEIDLRTISVQPALSSAKEVNRVQFQFSLRGNYSNVKMLLSEVLSRYPSTGVQTLQMRALPEDSLRIESQVLLVWHVKD